MFLQIQPAHRTTYYTWSVFLVLALTILLSPELVQSQESDSPKTESEETIETSQQELNQRGFTSEILPVFYVKDVLKSVFFWQDTLGFEAHHFFEHKKGGSVAVWTAEYPPIYVEMRSGEQKFALHAATTDYQKTVGGVRHYFGVVDVRAQHEKLINLGLELEEIIEREWMHMFRVFDSDGHEIYFFTRPDGD